ncbi:ACT domain-containing protein [Candidatus Saccharibacteria bacterium]|nr:ACT domain-containing protein [Candidatus Saccharibacteria bacterium]
MRKVAIQGKLASYHDIAAKKFFGQDTQTVNFDLPFKNVFKGLKKHGNAVVAIENSLYGSINEVYDLLASNKYQIVGEVYLRIEHCLIGTPGATIKNLTEVHSHPIALAQCENYLDSTLKHVQRFEHFDTAGSVEAAKQWSNPKIAAIASKEAATLHDMEILAKNIETNKENYTRFVVLSTQEKRQSMPTKASLILKTADKPGALHEALGVFTQLNLNLSKLESRPIIGKAWHYMFYIDIESPDINSKLELAIKDLLLKRCEVQLLGAYEKG